MSDPNQIPAHVPLRRLENGQPCMPSSMYSRCPFWPAAVQRYRDALLVWVRENPLPDFDDDLDAEANDDDDEADLDDAFEQCDACGRWQLDADGCDCGGYGRER